MGYKYMKNLSENPFTFRKKQNPLVKKQKKSPPTSPAHLTAAAHDEIVGKISKSTHVFPQKFSTKKTIRGYYSLRQKTAKNAKSSKKTSVFCKLCVTF